MTQYNLYTYHIGMYFSLEILFPPIMYNLSLDLLLANVRSSVESSNQVLKMDVVNTGLPMCVQLMQELFSRAAV